MDPGSTGRTVLPTLAPQGRLRLALRRRRWARPGERHVPMGWGRLALDGTRIAIYRENNRACYGDDREDCRGPAAQPPSPTSPRSIRRFARGLSARGVGEDAAGPRLLPRTRDRGGEDIGPFDGERAVGRDGHRLPSK